jgi:hypothetical protein
MITLRWAKFPEADVVAYKIFRSIIGFVAPLSDLTNKTLQLKINGGPLQTINFSGPDAISQINAQVQCAAAFASYDGINFLLRSNTREAPGSVEIVGGSAMVTLGLTPRLITETSEDRLIATVPADPDPTAQLEYIDQDGTPSDYYSISTVNSLSVESIKSTYRKAIPTCGPMCVIEGIIMNAQGTRIADSEVTATVQVPPERLNKMIGINRDPITVYSGSDGRFSLPLLQGILVRLEIPDIKLIRMIIVPNQAYVFLNDLPADDEYQYPLGYKSNPALEQ